LYRTWRPRTFADLVGQDAVVRTLSSAIEGGKLAHAYLFSGPRGSGKTSAAKILARCINCVAGPTPLPDNTCENCRAILAAPRLTSSKSMQRATVESTRFERSARR